MSKEHSWREIFQRQAAYGRRWKEIYKDNHDSTLFLERSDAVSIIKRAQLDVYDEIIEDFARCGWVKGVFLKKRKELAESDISALGMRGLDIEALRSKFDDILDNMDALEMDKWLRKYRDEQTP